MSTSAHRWLTIALLLIVGLSIPVTGVTALPPTTSTDGTSGPSTASTADVTAATAVTPCPAVADAIDVDDDGTIGNIEVLTAIEYWRTEELVLGTCGEIIEHTHILELIERWRAQSTVPIGGNTLEVHSINVGQADATLLIAPTGETMLIDSAGWHDDGETVKNYLDAQGVEHLDYLIATHAHADHIGGHAALIEYYETEKRGIGQAWDPGVPHTTQTYEQYLNAIETHDVDLIEARERDEIPMGGVDVQVYNPPHNSSNPDGFHYNSLTLRLQYGDAEFLFTGDAEGDAEARMTTTYGGELDADVYQTGHHGSQSSSTAPFLDTVTPRLTLISSAYESQYGHPHNETLQRFAVRSVDTYWTGTHGSIVAVTDGTEIVLYTQHPATTDPHRLKAAVKATAAPSAPVEERHRYPANTTSESMASPGGMAVLVE